MKTEKSLFNLSLLYFFGSFSSKFFSFFFVFFLTHFISKETLGEYDLILNTISLLVPIISLQMGASVVRWLMENDDETFKRQVLENSFSFIIICVFIYTIAFISFNKYFNFKFSNYVYTLSILQVIFTIIQQGLRGIGKVKQFVLSNSLITLFAISASVINLIYFHRGLEGVLLSNVLAYVAVILFLIARNKLYKYLTFNFSLDLVKKMLKYSLPLLPNGFVWWVIISSSRYIILYYLGLNSNGIFAVSYKLPAIISMISDVFYLAWQDKFLMLFESENQQYFNNILKKYVSFLLTAIIVISSLSKYFAFYFIEKSFFDSFRYVPILLYAFVLQALAGFYGSFYLKSRQTLKIFISSVTGSIVAVFTAWISIKHLGLYGVSFSILLGFLAMLLIRLKDLEGKHITFPYKSFAFLSLIYITVSSINFDNSRNLSLISITVSICFFLYYNRFLYTLIKSKILNDK